MISLLNKFTLSITRKDAGTGYYDDDYNYVEGTTSNFNIQCSIQPFKEGKGKDDLPEGVSSRDVRVVLTKTELRTAEESTNQEADETVIDGITYVCFDAANWTGHGLNSDHYRCLFIKKDKL